jgi:hypothetical protein
VKPLGRPSENGTDEGPHRPDLGGRSASTGMAPTPPATAGLCRVLRPPSATPASTATTPTPSATAGLCRVLRPRARRARHRCLYRPRLYEAAPPNANAVSALERSLAITSRDKLSAPRTNVTGRETDVPVAHTSAYRETRSRPGIGTTRRIPPLQDTTVPWAHSTFPHGYSLEGESPPTARFRGKPRRGDPAMPPSTQWRRTSTRAAMGSHRRRAQTCSDRWSRQRPRTGDGSAGASFT